MIEPWLASIQHFFRKDMAFIWPSKGLVESSRSSRFWDPGLNRVEYSVLLDAHPLPIFSPSY